MADILYYVSAQHGKDTNTGLSEEQAWATLTKAAQTVQTPAAGNQHIIVWGPGTYREKITFAHGGRSATERIIYRPDPNCLYLTQDKPGRCRVTGCDVNEMASTGICVTFNNTSYVQFGDFGVWCIVDGVNGPAVNLGSGTGQVAVQVRAHAGHNGFTNGANGECYQCIAQAAVVGFSGGYCTNCLAEGGSTGFKDASSVGCVCMGCGTGFTGTIMNNCTALGSYVGFKGSPVNCAAYACQRGYGQGAVFSSGAFGCYYAYYGTSSSDMVYVYDCTSYSCDYDFYSQSWLGGDGSITSGAACVGDFGKAPWLASGIKGESGWHAHSNWPISDTTTTWDLSAPRTIDLTLPRNVRGVSKAVAIYIKRLAASGTVTCALEKYTNKWVVQRSKTMNVSDLVADRHNMFVWDTGDGDDRLTTGTDTWRFSVTASAEATSTTVAVVSSRIVHAGFLEPDPMTDIDGRPRPWPMSIGAYEPPNMELDWTTFKTTAPAIRLKGHSMHLMQVPATAGKAIMVKWWVRHSGTDTGKLPQVWLRGPSIATQIATHSGAEDTWQELTVTATPTINTVLEVCLFSRDAAGTSYSIFSDPEVSIA